MFHIKDILLAIVGVIIGLNIGYATGHWIGVDKGKSQQKTITIEKIVQVKEKQREIRNNRPDALGVINRLQSGSF
ncbi:hypothetical protein [Dyadobacter psychrotolerans]|uniref:Uncharacterized protein n=1 Tax=Dyadobacter psychrotolerans TaxID=2541721 RepID=A0A4R5DYW0_9BACT|nr:hypothetical protein [Dyadobacter psychrotolerans]TDE17730.1 hypothetical protein E0F88_07515 [Dyadobacter psychrotolerans]